MNININNINNIINTNNIININNINNSIKNIIIINIINITNSNITNINITNINCANGTDNKTIASGNCGGSAVEPMGRRRTERQPLELWRLVLYFRPAL